ncbi:MAG: ROK family protein [Bacilli bacterium]
MSVFCVDVGGTFTKCGVVSSEGYMLSNKLFRTPPSYQQLLNQIEILFEESTAKNKKVICLSTPCNYIDGKLRGESYVKYIIEKDIVGDVSKLLNVKAYIENDGNCSGLGEYFSGAAIGSNNFVNIVIGSGIGGCSILEGKLLKGANFIASDIGYMLLHPDLRKNGNNLSFGVQGGTKLLVEKAQKIDGNINNAEAVLISEDIEIIKLRNNFFRYISLGIINVMYVLDPEFFLLSGGISEDSNFIPLLEAEVDKVLLELSYQYKPQIKLSKHKNYSNLIGAAYLHYREMN